MYKYLEKRNSKCNICFFVFIFNLYSLLVYMHLWIDLILNVTLTYILTYGRQFR